MSKVFYQIKLKNLLGIRIGVNRVCGHVLCVFIRTLGLVNALLYEKSFARDSRALHYQFNALFHFCIVAFYM